MALPAGALTGLAGAIRLFAGDFRDHDVHPSLIAFLDVVQVPLFPAEPLAFSLGNGRGRHFQVDDALGSSGRPALIDRDQKPVRGLVMEGIHGLDRQGFIVIAIEGVPLGRGTTTE